MTRAARAIVLFERDARAEEREKNLPRRVLSVLRTRLEREVRRLPEVDVWIASSRGSVLRLRCGDEEIEELAPTLRDQLQSASEHLRRYEAVTFLATDVLAGRALVSEALAATTPQRFVVGDSPDGGFYLFSWSGALPFDWNEVDLSAGKAAQSLRSAVKRAGREVVDAPFCDDIDSREALTRAAAALRTRGEFALASRLNRSVVIAFPPPIDLPRIALSAPAIDSRPPPAG